MCIFFSGIVTRAGNILFCEDDSHEEVIRRARLKDDRLINRDFVRIEVKDGDIDNYREDEPRTLPEWYDEEETIKKLERILPKIKTVREEFNKIKRQALKEYDKIELPAWEKHNRIIQQMEEEYINKLSKIEGYVRE